MPELKVWIDDENLLEYLGGSSKGTLLDDIGPWSEPATVAKLGLTMPSMSGESPIKSGLSRVGSEVEDGYATPRWGQGQHLTWVDQAHVHGQVQQYTASEHARTRYRWIVKPLCTPP